MENRLLTTLEVAERLGVHRTRVNVLIQEGRLPATRYGKSFLVQESDLALVSDRPVGRPKKEGAAEEVPLEAIATPTPSKKTPATRTPAQKRAIAAEQQRRWKGEQLTLPAVSSKKSPAVNAKAAKKGGKK